MHKFRSTLIALVLGCGAAAQAVAPSIPSAVDDTLLVQRVAASFAVLTSDVFARPETTGKRSATVAASQAADTAGAEDKIRPMMLLAGLMIMGVIVKRRSNRRG
jgi:hypothetical protein